jgi:hypothetical protein
MAKGGGHGLPKVSPGQTMPNISMPCGWPSLKRPYNHPVSGHPAAVFYPLGHPTPYASGGDAMLEVWISLFTFSFVFFFCVSPFVFLLSCQFFIHFALLRGRVVGSRKPH